VGDEGTASVGDGDLLAVASSPYLMLAAVAVLYPSLHLGEFPELLVCHAVSLQGHGLGVNPSEIGQNFVHLVGIDGGVIPCHTVASLDEVATDHAVSHAADELLPWGLVVRAELNARFSGVVEELIIANPEGSVPRFVVGESVHDVVCLVDVVSLEAAPLSGGR